MPRQKRLQSATGIYHVILGMKNDSNGALTYDSNRGINSITYDYSHYPSTIARLTQLKTVYNDYTPDGKKLFSRHLSYIPNGNGSNTRVNIQDLYIDDLMLRGGTPLIWKFNGGYVELNANGTPTSWNYYVTDHLGSTRMVVDSNDSIKEVINYYPFGSEMRMTNPALLTGGTSHPYRFTGKELDKLNSLNMYDFGARWYDVAGVPMWTSVDPLAENYYNVSPYAYCANNPVMFIDEHGDSLTLSGKQEDINSTLSVYNQGLGGYYQVSTDKNGLVILNANKNADPANMTDKEIQVYKELKRIIDSEYMTTINILNNSSEVTIGYAPTATIDIWDINAMSGLENSSPIAALMHETNEQSFIQDPNWHPNDANRVHKAHFSAEGLERMYTGNFGVTNWITTDGYVEFLRDNRVIERKKIW